MILIERDFEEVVDSQERLLMRRNQVLSATPERRRMLKDEYVRTLCRVKAMLTRRPDTQLLVIKHRKVISDPVNVAERVNRVSRRWTGHSGDGWECSSVANLGTPRKLSAK